MLADSAGVDLVKSTVSGTLVAGFEKLTLLGAAAISGTGNTVNNAIIRNNAVNTLAGLAGNDTLSGFGGNDLIIGGVGKDNMTGGAGADDFDFNSLAEIGRGSTRDDGLSAFVDVDVGRACWPAVKRGLFSNRTNRVRSTIAAPVVLPNSAPRAPPVLRVSVGAVGEASIASHTVSRESAAARVSCSNSAQSVLHEGVIISVECQL